MGSSMEADGSPGGMYLCRRTTQLMLLTEASTEAERDRRLRLERRKTSSIHLSVCFPNLLSTSRNHDYWEGTLLAGNFNEARANAELKFRKAEREATSFDRAIAENAAESEKRRIKSANLKELRLKKEAEQLAAGNRGSTKADE